MAAKHKVSVSTEPKSYRMSANERRAAHLADIAGQQGVLKQEAADRRAARAEAESARTDETPARPGAAAGRADPR